MQDRPDHRGGGTSDSRARGSRGIVFDIQRFSLHDGPGIRTTVFLKGCPLHCAWCHNPESRDGVPEIAWTPDLCIACGRCFSVCPRHGHRLTRGKRVFDRRRCTRCGACADACPAGALEKIGTSMSVEAVMAVVLRDRPFYETSGGGMTISGGEPMAQYEFTRALLAAAREPALHTCLETSGYGKPEHYHALLSLVNVFLFDYKDSDPARHRRYTGESLERLMVNLERLDAWKADVMLRCPIVGGINAEKRHFDGMARLANRLTCVREIHLLPYHPMGSGKSGRIGRASVPGPFYSPTGEDRATFQEYLAGQVDIPVKWL